jgi:hypothetical protein
MADPSQILAPRASLLDYQRLQQEFEMQKALTGAQMKKAMQLDVDQLGEQAFMKAAQGLPLTPQELAAAQFIDAKSGGIQFDPVNGGMIQKPRLSDKIGLPGGMPQVADSDAQANAVLGQLLGGGMPQPSGKVSMPSAPMGGGNPRDEIEARFQEQMAAAAGNPKLQQALQTEYAKSRMMPNEEQAKASGFSDRLIEADSVISTPTATEAGTSALQSVASKVPLVGNYLVSDEFQMSDQAKRNFINAQLRRESGAAIAPSEFENANKQYFPQPGDSPAVIAQKKQNRKTAIQSMKKSSGASYTPPLDPDQPVVPPTGNTVKWGDLR